MHTKKNENKKLKKQQKIRKKTHKNIIKIARPANSIDSQSWVTSENLKHKRILSVGCFFVYIAFFRMLCIHHTFFVFRVFLLSTQTIESKKMNCLPSRVWRTFFCIANVHVERFLLPLQSLIFIVTICSLGWEQVDLYQKCLQVDIQINQRAH